MAKKLTTELVADNSTDARFRAWVQFIDDAFLITGLWTHAGDSGQMTIATAAHPTLANTKVGYRIYAMADSLSGTAPCVVKVFYGSGDGSANQAAMWLVVGTGSDGSGGITGKMYDDGAVANPTVKAAATVTSLNICYASADTDRITIGMFVQTSNSAAIMTFGLERSHPTTNNQNTDSDGFQMMWSPQGSPTIKSKFLDPSFVLASQAPTETGVAYVRGCDANMPSTHGSCASNVLAGLPVFFKGSAQVSGLNWAIIKKNLELQPGAIVTVGRVFGVKYVSLFPGAVTDTDNVQHTNDILYMRWD